MMKKLNNINCTLIIAIISVLLSSLTVSAQTTNPNLLVNVQKASQAEIDAYAVADLEIGMLVYNTDINRIFEYTDTGFQELLTTRATSYAGAFVITTAATGTNPTAPVTFSQTVTGLPFRPNQITTTAHANVESLTSNGSNPDTNGNNPNFAYGISNGFARTDGATITQQVINGGTSGASVNDVGWYSSPLQCVGMRYGNNDGDFLGLITASVTSFTADGFVLSVTYTPGTEGGITNQNRIFLEDLVVLYTATR